VIVAPGTSASCVETAAMQRSVSSRLFQLTMTTSATLLSGSLRCVA
jgi:hypothetical protein